jgi:hypothetical protein
MTLFHKFCTLNLQILWDRYFPVSSWENCVLQRVMTFPKVWYWANVRERNVRSLWMDSHKAELSLSLISAQSTFLFPHCALGIRALFLFLWALIHSTISHLKDCTTSSSCLRHRARWFISKCLFLPFFLTAPTSCPRVLSNLGWSAA